MWARWGSTPRWGAASIRTGFVYGSQTSAFQSLLNVFAVHSEPAACDSLGVSDWWFIENETLVLRMFDCSRFDADSRKQDVDPAWESGSASGHRQTAMVLSVCLSSNAAGSQHQFISIGAKRVAVVRRENSP